MLTWAGESFSASDAKLYIKGTKSISIVVGYMIADKISSNKHWFNG